MTGVRKDGNVAGAASVGWWRPAWLTLGAVSGILVLFHETFWSMVSLWRDSNIYAHGFLIFPISAWLVWDKRQHLARLKPRPEFRVLGLILVAGFGWLLAHLLHLQVLEQVALIALLILSVWCVLGTAVARTLAFPLGFLFLAVPVVPISEALIPPLMDFTADFAVKMLQLSGLPVYREGTLFSLSSSNWSVEEACSGIRYLIASTTLGVLYAYLTYRSLLRRIVFVGFAIVLPIIANGLRAYMIVMIAHLSDMKLALGVDHLIYGWVFFGVVIMIMFLIGSIWRQPLEHLPQASTATNSAVSPRHNPGTVKRFAGAGLASLLAAAIWPAISSEITLSPAGNSQVDLEVPSGVGGWHEEADWLWMWWPRVRRADGEFYKFYGKAGHVVSLYVGQVRSQRQDVELTSAKNVTVGRRAGAWPSKSESTRRLRVGGEDLAVNQSELAIPNLRGGDWQQLLIWHWYRLGDRYTSSPYLGKLMEVWTRITGGRRDAALIVLATPYAKDPEAGAEVLKAFAREMLPEVERVLDRAVGAGPT